MFGLSLMVNLILTTLNCFNFFFKSNYKLPNYTHFFVYVRPLFTSKKQHQIHPPSQFIRRVGTLLFHAVAIKHAPCTCNNAALSRSPSIPTETLHKEQLQTSFKLRPNGHLGAVRQLA